MTFSADDYKAATLAVQEVLDQYIPGWAKSMIPAAAAGDLANAALKAVSQTEHN